MFKFYVELTSDSCYCVLSRVGARGISERRLEQPAHLMPSAPRGATAHRENVELLV